MIKNNKNIIGLKEFRENTKTFISDIEEGSSFIVMKKGGIDIDELLDDDLYSFYSEEFSTLSELDEEFKKLTRAQINAIVKIAKAIKLQRITTWDNVVQFMINKSYLRDDSPISMIELIRYASNILSINEQREIFNLAPNQINLLELAKLENLKDTLKAALHENPTNNIKDGKFDKETELKGEVEFKKVSFKYPDSEEYVLKEGDAYFVPPNTQHKFVATGETEAIDVFNPIKTDIPKKK